MKKRQTKKSKTGLLSHYSHTGKVLPKHHTSFPLLAFLVLLIGVLLSNVTFTTVAETGSYNVNASVKGVTPTQPAEISTPTNGTTVTEAPIIVVGSCPAGTMVKLYRNGIFSGAALCTAGGTFSIETDLFVGSNTLLTRVFNTVDDEGPPGAAITIIYKPIIPVANQPVVTNPQTNPPTAPSASPFIIKSENLFRGYEVGETVEWQVEIVGGTAPYAVNIDWGDGSQDVISRREAGVFKIAHTYKKAPPQGTGDYEIKISGSDASGETTMLQLMIIVTAKNFIPVTANTSSPSLPNRYLLLFSWSAFAVTALMLGSFWLGERRAFELIARRLLGRGHIPRSH